MSDTVIAPPTSKAKAEEWAERIAAQQHSKLSVKQFCKERGLTAWSFYAWRKRLRDEGPVRFAWWKEEAHGRSGGPPTRIWSWC